MKKTSAFAKIFIITVFTVLLSFPAYAASKTDAKGPGVSWVKDPVSESWMYLKGGEFVCNEWAFVNGFWYLFDENCSMMTGWVEKDGKTYYLNPAEDDDAHPQGSLFTKCLTPDGYYVDKDGVKVSGASEDNPLADPTCIEVNITEQIVNMYLDNKLVMSTPCVTGWQNAGSGTPTGRFGIYNKESDRYLQGYNRDGSKYKSYVHYWMPFNGSIGLHDATWRKSFGGNIYKTGGSHGCVNLPLNAATQIFNTIDIGWPVIVHY